MSRRVSGTKPYLVYREPGPELPHRYSPVRDSALLLEGALRQGPRSPLGREDGVETETLRAGRLCDDQATEISFEQARLAPRFAVGDDAPEASPPPRHVLQQGQDSRDAQLRVDIG